jgi:hypothetical protein
VGPGAVKEALNGIGLHMNVPSGEKIIDNTKAWKKLNTLKCSSYTELSSLVGFELGNVLVREKDLSFLGVVKSTKTIQKASLASSIWTNDREDFTMAHIGINILECINTIEM